MAERSLIEDGVSSSKIRGVSFGWEPRRFEGGSRSLPPIDAATFLFVGTICLRKGAHLLLQYWARSGIRGRLVLVGRIEPVIEQLCAKYLKRDDVILIEYTRDLGPLYRSADAFVFPSLEEGGPQVTYEACGSGLPVITSPMGAARIADASTGYVIDPFDEAGWIDAMRTLAADGDLRKRLGASAREKAQDYTWAKVSVARQKVFAEATGHLSSGPPVRAEIRGVTPLSAASRGASG
jgi:glycosyltransferase involved in cell wall biosynthesis